MWAWWYLGDSKKNKGGWKVIKGLVSGKYVYMFQENMFRENIFQANTKCDFPCSGQESCLRKIMFQENMFHFRQIRNESSPSHLLTFSPIIGLHLMI
jgi:hypothetical protein